MVTQISYERTTTKINFNPAGINKPLEPLDGHNWRLVSAIYIRGQVSPSQIIFYWEREIIKSSLT